MTTNITDIDAKQMASDSRWTISWPAELPKYVVRLDDSGCDKIVIYQGLVFIFAGDGLLIQIWKDWLATFPPTSLAGMPPVKREAGGKLIWICLCIVEMTTADILFVEKQEFEPNQTSPSAFFAGTGAPHARPCWRKNRNARRAVETAKAADIFSGGEVKYVNLVSGDHNLGNSESIHDVSLRLVREGFVMEYQHISQKTAPPEAGEPIAEAAKSNPELQKLVDDVKSGRTVASAPFGSMHEPWSPGSEQRLRDVLAKAFAAKQRSGQSAN